MFIQTKMASTLTSLVMLLVAAVQCSPGSSLEQAVPAEESQSAKIAVADVYANATTVNGAVYLELVNEGESADNLLSVETDEAARAELHEAKLDENEVMQMRPVSDIEVPAGSSVTLKPGGLHIMLVDLRQDLAAGDKISLTLNFEQSGPMTIEAEVRQGVVRQHQIEEHEESSTHEDEHDVGAGAIFEDLAPIALAEGEKLQVVATTNIAGDLVNNIGGGLIDLTIMLPIGSDPHTFAPTPQDAAAVADADLIFVNGLGLEEFLEELIENAGGEAPIVVTAGGVKTREFDEDEAHEPSAVDPHIWTTPANAIVMVQNIEGALSALDPANAATFETNAEAYEAQLEELDAWVKTQIERIPAENRKMVTDHDSFGYYAERYGLEIVGAVIPAYSTNAEPSAQELAQLQDVIGEYGVQAVFVGTPVNPVLAERLARDTGVQLVPLYTGSLGEAGSDAETYIDYIRYNTQAIVEALQPKS